MLSRIQNVIHRTVRVDLFIFTLAFTPPSRKQRFKVDYTNAFQSNVNINNIEL